MPRAIWTGSISLGLVNVPVKLYSAVSEKDIGFHQLDERGSRIRYKRVSEKTGREVPYDKIKRGFEIDRDRYVVFEQEEIERLRPEATKTIDIEDFVDLQDIDPIYYEHTYYLAPEGGRSGAAKAYRLLVEAMERQGKVAVGRLVLRTKQYVAVLRPSEGALLLSTMLFADEVVPRSQINELEGSSPRVSERELRMASQIIDSLSTEWEPERYHDTYREQVIDLVERKAKGESIEPEEPEPSRGEVVDLMSALEASLAATGSRRTKGGGTRRTQGSQGGRTKRSRTRAGAQKRSSGAKRRSA
ncbi:MAG TPA: Ku protein [Acidimicrobiales bacterium]|nr:Ku protein [Acidimicrobiales bacterium]